jgi:hypothetical protein
MKYIWVVESSGGKKWNPAGGPYPAAYFTKRRAKMSMAVNTRFSSGLKWRVAKYERVK